MLELNKLYLGDCLEVMKEIDDNSIDMVLVDPPYTMTKRGKSCRPNYMPNNMGDNVFSGKLPTCKDWFKHSYRILKENTHMYVFCNTISINDFLNVAKECGFLFHNIISIIKDTHMPNRWYLKYTEFILFFRKGKAKPINDMKSRDYFNVIMPKSNNDKIHITQKPLNIIEKMITNSSKVGEIVLDFFVGSGTTAIAAIRTKRQWIGIEKDEKYYKLASERIEKELNKLELF